MTVMDFLYFIVLRLIALWKLFTLLLIKLFSNRIKLHIQKTFASAGIKMIDCFDENGVQNGAGSSKNGKIKCNPWDMKIYNKNFYNRVAQHGTMGMGEAYVEGWWDCEAIEELFTRKMGAGLYKKSMYPWDYLIHYLQFDLFNLQTASRAYEVGVKHYDLGNKLFESFLDPSLNYSCAYWKNAKNLNEAQQHKMELIGRKLKLKAGMRVLDVGCGFGGLAKFLAETYKVTVVGCTISVEQGKLAQEKCKGLPVDIRVVDYREIDEKFDRIVSVGILEHIGRKNYRTFFEIMNRNLVAHGIFLVHSIGLDNDDVPAIEPWFGTYIFPNGILPYHTNIPKEIDNLFTIEDWHNFGFDYNKTCFAWYHNFVKNWPTIQNLFEGEEEGSAKRFFRMWSYYLLVSVGAFRSRKYQLWQVVLSKNGVLGGYESIR